MSEQARLFDIPEPDVTLAAWDWIVVNSSAGKDSLAMLDVVAERAAQEGVQERVVVVHADLGRVEWPGTRELAERQADRYGLLFAVVARRQGDLLQHIEQRGKFPSSAIRYCTGHHKQNQVSRLHTALTDGARDGDLLHHIEERGMFPSPRQRYCTSDHKRAQIARLFTYLADLTRRVENRPVRILNCMGMRADESPARAKKQMLTRNEAASNGRREVWDWLPLHRWTEPEVWERIRASRAADLVHPAYSYGMPRLSCCFCIFAPKAALVLAGRHNPELLAEYVRVEKAIGHTFRIDLSLADVQATVLAGEATEQVTTWTM